MQRESCAARRYLRVIYSVPKVHLKIRKPNMLSVQRDYSLTLYFTCWQKIGSKGWKNKGMGVTMHQNHGQVERSVIYLESPPQNLLNTGCTSWECSLNQARDSSLHQVNQTWRLIIFQAKSYLQLVVFLLHSLMQKQFSAHQADGQTQTDKQLPKTPTNSCSQCLLPVIHRKHANRGSKKHRDCQNSAATSIRKVLHLFMANFFTLMGCYRLWMGFLRELCLRTESFLFFMLPSPPTWNHV